MMPGVLGTMKKAGFAAEDSLTPHARDLPPFPSAHRIG